MTTPVGYNAPAQRSLHVYAFDPSLGRLYGNDMMIRIGYEKLEPGPVGERFAVVDYDGFAKKFYQPVNLDDPRVLANNGLDPTEFDPRFHQQMVYAVASETLERFEAALGRRVHWRLQHEEKRGKLNRLHLFPHAMAQANAFYSPQLHGIMFGYFRAPAGIDAQVVPGQTIFTCLSHDIVAHETTHAVVDGIRSYFMEPTNIDVTAFHEAFADLAALFRHFSHREVLLDTLQRTGGRLYTSTLTADTSQTGQTPVIQAEIAPDNPLIELARQFGQVSGLRNGLRSALGTPARPDDLRRTLEPHARGSILVAAVFDAYFSVYLQQTADLFKIFRAGGASANPVDLPDPLAQRLAREASDIADLFFSVLARAIDYCPAVDITFGDFLRAIITADTDLFPDDKYGVRNAIMQAFRSRGIVPDDAHFFSEDALCWPTLDVGDLPDLDGLLFGDPNGLTTEEKNHNGDLLRAYAAKNYKRLGFTSSVVSVPSFHPTFRTAEDGSLMIDMVIEMIQTPEKKPMAYGVPPARTGLTLIVGKPPVLAGNRAAPRARFKILKSVDHERAYAVRTSYVNEGLADPQAHDETTINFGLVHAL